MAFYPHSFSLSAFCIAASISASAVLAQTPSSIAPQGRVYAIEAGPLDEVLVQFARESGALLAAPPELLQNRRSPGVHGVLTPQSALERVLTGTGLQAESNAQGQFVLYERDDAVAQLSAIMVVSAAGYEQDIRSAPASISVISSEDIAKRQFGSLQDIVREVPGVSVIGSGTQSGISIRGMEKGYTLVLVDGKRVRSETGNPRELNNEDLDSNFIPPLASIDRIEVVRGPMSSLYGSDAMGGVINIITKRTPQTWSGSAQFGFREPDSGAMGSQWQRSFYLSGPVVPGLLSVSAWHNDIHQNEDRYHGGYQASDKRTVGGKLRLTPAHDHDLTFDYAKSSQHYRGHPGGVLLSTASTAANREWTRHAWGAAYQGGFDLGQVELKYYQEKYERLVHPRGNASATGSTNQVADAKFVTGLGSHTLTAGTQWTRDRLTNSDLGNGRTVNYGTRKIRELAWFAEDEWELIDDTLFFTTGMRWTDNQFFGGNLSPRGYLVYHHNDAWTFKGGVATGYKSPKITQIDESTGSVRRSTYLIGNGELKPEKSTSYEIGALYDNDGSWRGGATLFYNDFSNKIVDTRPHVFSDSTGAPITGFCLRGAPGSRNCPYWGTWVNVKGAKIFGVELDSRWQIGHTLSLKGNYTYTHSRINAGNITVNTPDGPRRFGNTLSALHGSSLVGIPEHNGSLTLDYRPNDSLSGFLRLNYEGQITQVSFENNQVDKSNKDLMTLDAGLSYTLNRYLSFNLTVDNIADAKRFKVSDDTGAYRFSERGRSYYASVTARF